MKIQTSEDRDEVSRSLPELSGFLKEHFPKISEEYDVDVNIEIRVYPRKLPDTLSEKVLIDNLENRLNYKAKQLAIMLESYIKTRLVNE